MEKWTKMVDIFNMDIVLIPVHLGAHWCLASVEMNSKSITYYDSKLGSNFTCLNAVSKYLEAEHFSKKGVRRSLTFLDAYASQERACQSQIFNLWNTLDDFILWKPWKHWKSWKV